MNKYVKLGIALFGGLLIIGLVLFLVLHDHLNKNDSGNKVGEENTPVVSDFLPSDTENLLNSYDAIVTSNVTLDRIDLFDNSNLFGDWSVSGMVVFKNGVPAKNEYRSNQCQASAHGSL